jgi:trk system potassium uptake protein TrkA
VKVAIAGAGNVGTAIAKDLGPTVTTSSHRQGPRPGRAAAAHSLDVTWVAADACEVSSLVAAGMADVDVAVAATGDDEDNLVISLLSKQEFAVPRVVARVNHPDNQWLFNESWGVDVSVSTPQLLTALVEEAVSVGSLVRLLQFERGHGQPGGGDPGRGLAGRRDEPWPTSTSPATPPSWPWSGSDRLVVPRGDTVLERRRRGAGPRHRRCRGGRPPAPGGAPDRPPARTDVGTAGRP